MAISSSGRPADRQERELSWLAPTGTRRGASRDSGPVSGTPTQYLKGAVSVERHAGLALDHFEHLPTDIDHEGPPLDRNRPKPSLDPKLPGNRSFSIAEKGYGQGVAFREFALPRDRIGADPDWLRPNFCKVRGQVTEVATLGSATPAQGRRIEEQNDRTQGQELGEPSPGTSLVWQLEVGRQLTLLHTPTVLSLLNRRAAGARCSQPDRLAPAAAGISSRDRLSRPAWPRRRVRRWPRAQPRWSWSQRWSGSESPN